MFFSTILFSYVFPLHLYFYISDMCLFLGQEWTGVNYVWLNGMWRRVGWGFTRRVFNVAHFLCYGEARSWLAASACMPRCLKSQVQVCILLISLSVKCSQRGMCVFYCVWFSCRFGTFVWVLGLSAYYVCVFIAFNSSTVDKELIKKKINPSVTWRTCLASFLEGSDSRTRSWS